MGFPYEKLRSGADKAMATTRPCSTRRRWVKRFNGRLIKGLRLSRSRKLSLKAFSSVILLPRISAFYTEIVGRMLKMDGSICPTIVFSSQWGLPVLSHPSVLCRKTAFSPEKDLYCF